MKIAMFGQKQIPSRAGGVEIVVEALSTRMVQQGHQVVCYDRGGESRNFQGVQIRPVWALKKKGLAAVSSSFLAALCSTFGDADVVHIHGEGPAFWCWIPKLFGKRVVVTVHGLDWQREKWKGSIASAYIRAGEAMAARYADAIIVLSRSMERYFQRTYRRNTVWIPNGITWPEPVPAKEITRRFGLKENGYILFLGRLVPEKGIHHLTEAYRNVKTDKTLVIAGAASDTDAYVSRLKKLAENANILFTGFVQGRLLEELYSNAYVYVLPSQLEGMPLSLLEAMSYGSCCLVSDIPECTEVTQDRAATFTSGNPEELREKLQQLCDDASLVRSYRETARSYVCEKYDWDTITQQTLELYR